METMLNNYCIVRGNRSGVFAGIVKEINGDQVLMTNVRRIWYWDGAATLSQMAMEGVTNPTGCKFTVEVNELLVLDAIEILRCTEAAEACIKAVKVWRR